MYNVTRKNNSLTKASFNTEDEAKTYLMNMGRQSNFFKIVSIDDKPLSLEDKLRKENDFEGAVRITRSNVKQFYKHQGIIKVFNETGKLLHTGKTTNMGKVFSNYVNCARYNQSYDFHLEDGGDILLFKEEILKQ